MQHGLEACFGCVAHLSFRVLLLDILPQLRLLELGFHAEADNSFVPPRIAPAVAIGVLESIPSYVRGFLASFCAGPHGTGCLSRGDTSAFLGQGSFAGRAHLLGDSD